MAQATRLRENPPQVERGRGNGRIQWDDDTGEPHLYRKDKWGSYTAKGRPTFNFEDYALDRALQDCATVRTEDLSPVRPKGLRPVCVSTGGSERFTD